MILISGVEAEDSIELVSLALVGIVSANSPLFLYSHTILLYCNTAQPVEASL